MDVCAMFRQPDIAWFYGLPASMQELWVEHIRNRITGAYEAAPKKTRRSPEQNMAAQREGLRRAKERAAGGGGR